MKKLIINPEFGLAGDMFSGALISAGADEKKVIGVMRDAGCLLGSVEIEAEHEKRGTVAGIHLRIAGKLNDHGIRADKARQLIEEVCARNSVREMYRNFALSALSILAGAEEKAHREIDSGSYKHDYTDEHQALNYHTSQSEVNYQQDSNHHDDDLHQHENSIHEHTADFSSAGTSPVLHEAQDIVIDLAGAAYALQLLNVDIYSVLCLEPVFIGSGTIRFSHGEFPVPAPATASIIRDFRIQAQSGPVEKELLTPTGAAILAALTTSYRKRTDFMKQADIKKMIAGVGFGTMKIESADQKPNALYLYLTE